MKDNPLDDQFGNLAYLEQLYSRFQSSPGEIDTAWRRWFQALESGAPIPLPSVARSSAPKRKRIEDLVQAYRQYGHLIAAIDPIGYKQITPPPQLDLGYLGFQPNEMNEMFPTLGFLPQAEASLQAILTAIQQRYCGSVGFECTGLCDLALDQWIQQHIESGEFDRPFQLEEKRLILENLNRAELLETFLHTRHVGKKRFSLEGGESLIPMLTMLVAKGAEEGIEEVFIGMSHRGRLNVLANVLNKSFHEIFKDFDEDYDPAPSEGTGDIRYHKGHVNESISTYKGYSVKLKMAPNPSHLESVNAVVEGQARAQQILVGDEPERRRVIPLLMHGDAALSGQGAVYETLQMCRLRGYETGGTVHFIINNQVGFTATPDETRSTMYCTDIAHAFGMPVFHVNAEDPEACVRTALFALKIRQQFHCDVFIDLYCYRKYGHNEGDEPAFTQPLEYKIIRKKKTIRELYNERLIREGVIDEKQSAEHIEELKKDLQDAYQAAAESSKEKEPQKNAPNQQTFNPFENIPTAIPLPLLQQAAEKSCVVPPGFNLHPKLEQLLSERLRAVKEDKPLDWGLVETLAYATLLWEGTPIRISGQDSGRGTFSHRHALLVDQVDHHDYFPLAHLHPEQGRFEVLNSFLSEQGVLGFEYGYSTVCEQGLTIWEAQFGDFVNSAQVIVDQYIASGEQKWGQTSGLVLYLPHGFEGQGPEHSSARLERFLNLTGHDNMQIVNPTTPAQLFHVLRRQVKQSWHKPLIVFTPKGLLRHPACTSRVADLTGGQFRLILDDPRKPDTIRSVVLCCGRVYYDLDAMRTKEKREDVAILRIEQLYPLDEEALKSLLAKYSQSKDFLWVQEEPENMGAWAYISMNVPPLLPSGTHLKFIGRERSASPATGFYARHRQEHAQILHQVFKT